MSVRRNRRQAGLASTQWIGIVVGVILIALGIQVFVGGFWDQSPIPGIDFAWGRFSIMLGIMLILFPVITTFFVVPLKEAIDERNGQLERTFTEAEELRESMKQLRKEYDQRLAASEASAKEQIQAQIREAQNLKQTLMAEATQRADALVAQAQQEIEQEKLKALHEIRTSVVDLTLSAAEKVVGENMDDARNRRLVEDFINRVEVAH